MALNYAKLFNRRVIPQSRPIPGSTQVNPVCRQRPRTVEVMAGNRLQCAGEFFRA